MFMPQGITLTLFGSCIEVGAHICLIICYESFSELLLCINRIKNQSTLYVNF